MARKGVEDAGLDERTPLIAPAPDAQPQENGRPFAADAEQTRHEPEQNAIEDVDVPLPKMQILLLCFVRMVEPISFFIIFPFVNQMIYDTGTVKEADVGYYSGLIESLFSLTQMCVMVAWGKASDRFGRKPVLVASLCGLTVACTLFGFATSIWQMILFRCFAGVFAGTIVTVRTMIAENSTPKTQARAFSFFAFAGNFGIFIGPVLGGGLARPAKEYPKVFGHVQLFKDYPYALPTIVTGVFAAIAAIVSTLFIKETLKHKKEGKEAAKPMSTLEILHAPGVSIVLAIYAIFMVLPLAFTAVIPVYYFTRVELGGFGWSPRMISLFMGLGGLSQSVWLLLVFPYLQHRIGTGGVLRLCSYAYPFFIGGWPVAQYLLKARVIPAFWVEVGTVQVIGSGVAMGFTAIQLSINDISPSSKALGSLNALALAIVSGIRAVAPALFAGLYARSVDQQILQGQLVWIVLLSLTFIFFVVLRWLPEKAQVRPVRETPEPAA